MSSLIVQVLCISFSLHEVLSIKIDLGGYWFVKAKHATRKVPKIVGNVPGGIYTDLQKAGIIDDPFYRFNDVKYRWVGKQDWKYYKSFTVTEKALNHSRVVLICEGLDTVSKLLINDKFIGKSDNMFVKYEFDVKSVLVPGTNAISVLFTSPLNYAKEQYSNYTWQKYPVPPSCRPPSEHGECHVNFVRKMQCSFGWDWGPAFPSVGIWKPIRIEARNDIVITDVTIHTKLESRENGVAGESWTVMIKLYVKKTDKASLQRHLTVELDDLIVSKQKVTLAGMTDMVTLNVDIPKDFTLKKWWPNGFGEQNLYSLSASLEDRTEKTSVNVTRRIGFKTIELVQEPVPKGKGLTFYFKINGIPMFAKGSNWIPAHILPEQATDDTISHLLTSAKEANMNMLRVWGGGIYESDKFYDLADELGILIWHDMMYACAMYQTGETFLESVREETKQQMRRLQHHPSIALWAGNNENEAALAQNWYQTRSRFKLYKNDYVKLYIDTIREVVESEDPYRIFLSSSPTNGPMTEQQGWVAKNPASNYYGDVHFYNYLRDLWDFRVYPKARFVSEYGYQGWPTFATIEPVSCPEDWNWKSRFVSHRQHVAIGQASIDRQIRLHFDLPSDDNETTYFRNFLYLSQVNQAVAIKTETETYRRHMSLMEPSGLGMTMGALYWQLNDVWQAPSWSSIEYGGKWKMLHYFAKRFFSPILVSPYMDVDNMLRIFVVSDDQPVTQRRRLNIAVNVFTWNDMKPRFSFNVSFWKPNFNSTQVYNRSVLSILAEAKIYDPANSLFYFELNDGSTMETISTNFLFPNVPKYLKSIPLKKADIKVQNVTLVCKDEDFATRTFNVTLTSDNIALFVWISVPGGTLGWFDDNGFVMVKPMVYVAYTTDDTGLSPAELQKGIEVESLMDIYS